MRNEVRNANADRIGNGGRNSRALRSVGPVLSGIEYKFSKKQLDNLLSHDWSNTTLKLNYTFFKLVDESKPLSEQRVDHLGNSRYYSRVYTFDNKKYLVTSQWYAKSKPFFISWYNTLRNTKK